DPVVGHDHEIEPEYGRSDAPDYGYDRMRVTPTMIKTRTQSSLNAVQDMINSAVTVQVASMQNTYTVSLKKVLRSC
ncbi:MAG: hypothetical protein VXU50_03095, partial [Verrucomicrobiota bacterium]|nr:hypothetical protein [Verrucomicrobiota bacterium]